MQSPGEQVFEEGHTEAVTSPSNIRSGGFSQPDCDFLPETHRILLLGDAQQVVKVLFFFMTYLIKLPQLER